MKNYILKLSFFCLVYQINSFSMNFPLPNFDTFSENGNEISQLVEENTMEKNENSIIRFQIPTFSQTSSPSRNHQAEKSKINISASFENILRGLSHVNIRNLLDDYHFNPNCMFVSASGRSIRGQFVPDDETPFLLLAAIHSENIEDFKYLLERADVNLKDKKGNTVVHCLCELDKSNFLEEIIKRGDFVNIQSDTGETPLATSVRCFSLNSIGLLLKSGANINDNVTGINMPIDGAQREIYSRSILHILIQSARDSNDSRIPECLYLLIKNGINLEMEDSIGNKAEYYISDEDNNLINIIQNAREYKRIAKSIWDFFVSLTSITFAVISYFPLRRFINKYASVSISIFSSLLLHIYLSTLNVNIPFIFDLEH